MRTQAFFLASIILIGGALSSISHAVVTTNITSSGLGTAVAPISGGVVTITGGTRAGTNLFHSFGLFNVGAGDTANFFNNTGLPTTNILSRVTGGNPSNIFGTIQTTDFGNANLFLINPAGVVFGPNASLSIGGSFHVSTADYLRLSDGVRFNAVPNVAQDALLSTAPVTAFGFLSSNPAPITFDNSTLSVPAGQTLSVVGGNITVTGGTLSAQGGQINLTSVAGAGEVAADTTMPAPGMALGTITLDQSILSTAGDISFGDGSGGAVSIRGGQLVATGATIITSPADFSAGSGGNVTISVTGSAAFTDSLIQTNSIQPDGSPVFPGPAGTVSITADGSLTVMNSFIDSSTTSALGDSGSVTLMAGGPLAMTNALINTGSTFSGPVAPGDPVNAGAFTAQGRDVTLDGVVVGAVGTGDTAGITKIRSGAVTLTATGTTGTVAISNSLILNNGDTTLLTGGPVTITGSTINILNGSIIDSSLSNGTLVSPANAGTIEIRGGNVNVTDSQLFSLNSGLPLSNGAGGSIRFLDAQNIQLTAAQVNSSATSGGGGGAIEFQTKALTISNLTDVATSSFGQGAGGTITVRGAGNVTIESGSRVLTDVVTGLPGAPQGTAGNISIETQNLTIRSGGLIRADGLPLSTGNAGHISVQGTNGAANSVLVDGVGSGIFTDAQGTGAGGNITLNANTVTLQNGGTLSAATSGTAASATGGTITVNANQVQLNNGATISASSSGPANAGNITVTAGDSLVMQGHSSISTQTSLSDGGNINIKAGRLVQLNNSQITTSVQGGLGNGGNITIDPQFVIVQGSQILANAFGGNGGNILIVAGVFLVDPTSTISASSTFGVSGTVNVQTTVTNLSESVAPLSGEFVHTPELLQARCAARFQGGQYSSFVVAGRDGLPLEPGGLLPSPLFVERQGSPKLAKAMDVPGLRFGRALEEASLVLAPLEMGCAS